RLGRDVERIDEMLQHERHADVGELGRDEECERDADAQTIAPDLRPEAAKDREEAGGAGVGVGHERVVTWGLPRRKQLGVNNRVVRRRYDPAPHRCRRALMRTRSLLAVALLLGSSVAFAQDAATARTKAPKGASVSILSPKNGAKVGQDVTVKF